MDRSRAPFYIPVIFTATTVIVAILLVPSRAFSVVYNSVFRVFYGISSLTTSHLISSKTSSRKTPVYFLSHGGPDIMCDISHPVYSKLREIGREITQLVKPKAIVVVSAHRKGKPNVIQVNTAEKINLTHDFHGFPEKCDEEKRPGNESKEVAEKMINLLTKAGIKTEAASQGLDHDVWASFKVAFNPGMNPLNVPVVQVSLFDTEDPDQHYNLGRAVAPLRSECIQIIVSGMGVHNLRDMQLGMIGDQPLPVTTGFNKALKKAATACPEAHQAKLAPLLNMKDTSTAAPTFEHLIPIFVGAGAAIDDKGVQLWTLPEEA